jgi:GTPase SAR1 family protein
MGILFKFLGKKCKNIIFGIGFIRKNNNDVYILILKKALLTQNKFHEIINPTTKPIIEEIKLNDIKFKIIELGGNEEQLKIWDEFLDLSDLNGIIFFVDSSDQTKFELSSEKLKKIFSIKNKLPILIFGTKIDLENSVKKEDLEKILNVVENHNSHPFNIIMTSLKDDSFYLDGFKWISQFIN